MLIMHNVIVEPSSRGSSSTSYQEQSLVVKTRHKDTRKRHHHQVSSSKGFDFSDVNNTLTHNSLRVNSHHSCVQSSAAPPHRGDDKVSISDEDEIIGI